MNKVIAKYIDVKIQFKTPCLADYWAGPPEDTCKFFRDDDECVVLRHRHLFAMLTRAKAAINSAIDIRKVDFVTAIVAETTVISVPPQEPDTIAKRECIPEGQVICLSFGVEKDVDYEGFMALMRAAGKDIGLSPAYAADGFGRFNVVEGRQEWLDSEPSQTPVEWTPGS
jgi:hypothetical protein